MLHIRLFNTFLTWFCWIGLIHCLKLDAPCSKLYFFIFNIIQISKNLDIKFLVLLSLINFVTNFPNPAIQKFNFVKNLIILFICRYNYSHSIITIDFSQTKLRKHKQMHNFKLQTVIAKEFQMISNWFKNCS